MLALKAARLITLKGQSPVEPYMMLCHHMRRCEPRG